jgi:hypothetical protein
MSAQFDALKEKIATESVAQLPLMVARLENALKIQATATIAAALITAAGRPVSVEEALAVRRDIHFALYGPDLANRVSFNGWEKDKDVRLRKPFK